MSLLSVHCLSKRFGAGLPVVNGLSFDVAEGERFALLGPSGCGKTTALRLAAGFERPDSGRVVLDGQRLVDEDGTWTPPERRGIGFVFQDYALFPHLSVRDNVRFGLRGVARKDRKGRVDEVLKLVDLAPFADRMPHQLSGGQQQRVALARAIAPRPRLVLLDEPFSNLDALLRQEMREKVRDLLAEQGMTAVLVTHDQEEAFTFADRVAVMQGGRIEQVGTPEGLYHRPRTLFVAQFLGQTNLVLVGADGRRAESPFGPLTLHREAAGPVLVSLRPEHLGLLRGPEIQSAYGASPGVVTARHFRGHDITYRVRLADGALGGGIDCLVHTDNRDPVEVGAAVAVRALEPAVVLDRAGEAPA